MKIPVVLFFAAILLLNGCKLQDEDQCEPVKTYHNLTTKSYAVGAYFSMSFTMFDTLSFASDTDTLTFARQPTTSWLYTEMTYQNERDVCVNYDYYENGKVIYTSINTNDSLTIRQDIKPGADARINAIWLKFNDYTFFAYGEWLGNDSHLTYIPEYKPSRNTSYYACNIIYSDSTDTTSSHILLQKNGVGILYIVDKQRNKTYSLLNPFYR